MLLEVMFASLVIGILRGGKLTGLADLPLEKVGLVITAFLIQYSLVFFGEGGYNLFSNWGVYLHILSYLLLLIAIWYSRSIRGMKIIGLGVLVNFIVILSNGGRMPVSVEALSRTGLDEMLPLLTSKAYVIHTILTPNSRLKLFSDIIPLPPPYPRPRVLSIGDIIMAVGVFVLIQQGMKSNIQKRG